MHLKRNVMRNCGVHVKMFDCRFWRFENGLDIVDISSETHEEMCYCECRCDKIC